MKYRLLDLLTCPLCGGDFELRNADTSTSRPSTETAPPTSCETCHAPAQHRRATPSEICVDCYGTEIQSGTLLCAQGHAFAVSEGVPRLGIDSQTNLADAAASDKAKASDARAIAESFGREWSHFRYEDRTWGENLADRRRLFVREVHSTEDSLVGKLVLDAGCGNGSLSRELNSLGCEVVAADVSHSVDVAHRHFAASGNARTHFVQGDLMNPPFRREAFDVVYSSGVLHHTPDTRQALNAIAQALAPGGTIYIWLYWTVPGFRQRFKQGFRRLVAPLPAPLKHLIVRLWLPQAMLRQYIRRKRGSERPEDAQRYRERLVHLLDHYTPRYRWEHTPDEVHRWYHELGFTDIVTTEERYWGFGVAARRPGQRASAWHSLEHLEQ